MTNAIVSTAAALTTLFLLSLILYSLSSSSGQYNNTHLFVKAFLIARHHQQARTKNNPRRVTNTVAFRASSTSSLAAAPAAPDAVLLTDHAPSWETLLEQVLATPTGLRLQREAADREKGLGPPHTDAPFRVFSDDDDDNDDDEDNSTNKNDNKNIRVTLYRDAAGWCPYCQKVWMFLEEKSIPYRVKKVPMNAYGDKPDWYTRMVDGGKLPAIEIDGNLHVESLHIMKLLEEEFPEKGPTMIPKNDDDDDGNHQFSISRMDTLLQLEQELQRAWFSLVFYPVKGEALIRAKETFLDTLKIVDHELGVTTDDGPWFLGGDTPSLVDLQYITQVERIIPSALYWKGISIRNNNNSGGLFSFPNLDRWLDAFDRRPSYRASKSDYYTHVMVLPSQNGPGYMIPEAKQIASQLCGLSGGTWRLPLNLTNALEPFPGSLDGDDDEDDDGAYSTKSACHEAAYELVENHDKVVQFACRGAGEPGRPSYHAELADPYAEPNEDYFQAVDIALRHVARALLHGVVDDGSVGRDAESDLFGKGGDNELRENWEAYQDEDDPSLTYYWNYETGDTTWTPPTQQLDTCLTYLRDRIGVPRDMSHAAAMQFRAHLNWAIDIMKD